jgi:hypothetical protein
MNIPFEDENRPFSEAEEDDNAEIVEDILNDSEGEEEGEDLFGNRLDR